MAYPFVHAFGLRQRLLLAIGSTFVSAPAALGCSVQQVDADAGAVAGKSGSAVTCKNGRATRECFTRATMESKAKFGCGQIAIQPVPSAEEVQSLFLPNGCLQHRVACDGCCNPAAAPGEPQGDGSCCYSYCGGACCGRPLIIDGQARTAGVELRGDWLRPLSAAEPLDLHQRIAHEWLEDALMEHASIASFARFTLDLLAFGAPAMLVERAQRAALEEVEHARLCFGLAARYSGCARGPAPLATTGIRCASNLWDAALAAFDEGCIGESIAALQAREALELAQDRDARHALERIAEQEAEHAELAFLFVSWATCRLGLAFQHEVDRRLGHLLAAKVSPQATEPADTIAALHAAGRLTAADQQRIRATGLREIVVPCVAALAASSGSPVASVTRPLVCS